MKGSYIMQVTCKGDPIEVKGTQPSVGDTAPNATVPHNKGDKEELADGIKGSVTSLRVVDDVSTRTCELQTKNFTEKTADKGYKYITLGRNTVDEFNEWNKENELNVDTYTDADGEFGKAYGLDIELGGDVRTTRSVFVVDKDGVIQY